MTLSLQDRTEDRYAATIGFFDGVHSGHHYLLTQMKRYAAEHDMRAMVVTFANHPRRFFGRDEVLLLSTEEEKTKALCAQGIDDILMLDFDAQIARLTSEEFITLLAERFNVKTLFVGHDHHFGSDTASGYDHYRAAGLKHGVEVLKADCFNACGVAVSSSKIRAALAQGDVEKAAQLLGRQYSCIGTVERGNQIGRTIGFPTANLRPRALKQMPLAGVYAVGVESRGSHYKAMMNIGNRPTVGGSTTTYEVHIFDFNDDIYGETIEVRFYHRIRAERDFSTLDLLAQQLENDKKETIEYFKKL